MAEKKYPRIPAKNWWALRNRFKRSLPSTVTVNYLSSLFGISEKAAKNVLGPLKTIGLLDESGNTTDRANRWRDDQEYAQVCAEIVRAIYPEELLHLAPTADTDLETVTGWFMSDAAVGERTAKDAARMYLSLARGDPNEGQGVTTSGSATPRSSSVSRSQRPKSKPADVEPAHSKRDRPGRHSYDGLHINIQLHISPDASPEQIDQIFASMAKHLHTNSGSDMDE